MEEILKTLPQHTCSWLKGRCTFYKYEGFWHFQNLLEGAILAQQTFKARSSDILLCSCPKSGTTWLKALAFAIVTRNQFDESSSPLLTTLPHLCIPSIENMIHEPMKENLPLVATHLPYATLPKSILASNCKIVYIYRNIKDVIVSYYHFMPKVSKLPVEDVSFEQVFDEVYQGISWGGPYWDHILGYWKASQERPGSVIFLKYEDMKRNARSNVTRLAEFLGYPFSAEEEKAGIVENIIKLCSFENLSNLEVNKSRNHHQNEPGFMENEYFFRKATDGDWKNYFTDEMKNKIDKLMDEKLSGTGLVLK
uniref:flavonol 4'-sulfotransferase-like n=1 Tax=Erigeron canadensis TaxID=72917 RepID=UPI001CB9D4E9|nr:flavonol 4'-sulfotransferase-like [Erigeron canadensis]